MKELNELTNTVLILLYDLNGTSPKTQEEVEKLLIKEVFEHMEKENFKKIGNYLRMIINNLPQREKDVFETALETFLREHFGLEK